MVKPKRRCSCFSCERSTHFMCGSMTVSGSSNRMALTSERTRPRPSEIFCFWSAVRPARLLVRPVGRGRASRAISRTLAVDLGLRHAAVAQREGQIVVDGHGVVDDRELEHLRDVALLRRQIGHVACRRTAAGPRDGVQQARDDVEQRGLAAARKGRAAHRRRHPRSCGRPPSAHSPASVADRAGRSGGYGRASMRAIAPPLMPPAVGAATARPPASKTMKWRGSRNTSTVSSGSKCVHAVRQHHPAHVGEIEMDEALRAGDLGDRHLGR